MSKLPDFFNCDQNIDEFILGLIDPAPLRDKFDPSKWTEEAGPVEVTPSELFTLLYAAKARGTDEDAARFLGAMLAKSLDEAEIPCLRLAVARSLSISPCYGLDVKDNVADIAYHLGRALRASSGKFGSDSPSSKFKSELAARFDWPVIAKRNSERIAERRKAEHRAAVAKEAKRCLNDRVAPTSDEVRAEMIARQQEMRERLRYDHDKGEGRSELDIRLWLARRGHGYEDGDFFLADRDTTVRELLRQKREAEEQAILADPAFVTGDNDGGPILEFFDDPEITGLLPAYVNGGVLEVIGPAQSYKSTMVARLCCTALARDPDLKVIYLAGEQPLQIDGFRRAYGAEEGLSAADIEKRFCLYGSMPALHEPNNADRVLKMVETLRPGIVVIDTWARAIAGLNENSNAVADLLAEDGPIGRLVARGVLVIVIGHCPLDGEKRLRGHGGANDNADARLWIVGNAKGFKVEVLKMKPLPAGHTIFATVPQVRKNLSQEERAKLPPAVITWCGKSEYDKAVHDPRPRVEQPTSAAEPERPLTRAEKARLRAQRNRDAQRVRSQGIENP
jgi:hypothetical protein